MWTLNGAQKIQADTIGMGSGENEALVLAVNFDLPLLIDDSQAYQVAKKLGIVVNSSLGFLRAAYRLCYINRQEYDPLVDNFARFDRATLYWVRWAREAPKLPSTSAMI